MFWVSVLSCNSLFALVFYSFSMEFAYGHIHYLICIHSRLPFQYIRIGIASDSSVVWTWEKEHYGNSPYHYLSPFLSQKSERKDFILNGINYKVESKWRMDLLSQKKKKKVRPHHQGNCQGQCLCTASFPAFYFHGDVIFYQVKIEGFSFLSFSFYCVAGQHISKSNRSLGGSVCLYKITQEFLMKWTHPKNYWREGYKVERTLTFLYIVSTRVSCLSGVGMDAFNVLKNHSWPMVQRSRKKMGHVCLFRIHWNWMHTNWSNILYSRIIKEVSVEGYEVVIWDL